MSSDEYLEIPTNLLGSWNYNQEIAIGIGDLHCTLLIEYAPSSMYELLNLKNPYKDKLEEILENMSSYLQADMENSQQKSL